MLAAGNRVGAYEIVAAIGAGGMGEIYRARDTRLKRDVALKILPASFASDPDRLARFQREAEVLASLNHPNIAAIHGLEQADGTRALVMELVDGETLADRIARGPIPVDEALPIAKQIAEALEAAHERGILALAVPATLYFRRGADEPAITRLDVVTPPTTDSFSFALSPNGRQLVFVANGEKGAQLWIRPLDQTMAQPLTGTEGTQYPFWSPDGFAVGFFADGKLKRIRSNRCSSRQKMNHHSTGHATTASYPTVCRIPRPPLTFLPCR